MKMIISAGGTGGHIYPAISIINKFREKEKNLEILYIGTHNRMEKDIIPAKNINYEALEIYGFSKSDMLRNIKNIGLINKACKKCEQIMKEFKPDIVLGIGGYVTYPVIKMAHKLGIKTFIHEQNLLPGKSNKMLEKMCDLIAVSFLQTLEKFDKCKKVVYTGNPCGENALLACSIDKAKYGLSKNKKLIIIVAGSLGSSSFNDKMKEFLLYSENKNYEVVYITGESYYEEFTNGTDFPSNIKVLPYFENLPSLMKSSDLMISRAGASSMSEILALEIPTIFIPSPYVANNEQYYNALNVVKNNAALMIEEKDLNGFKLIEQVQNLLDNEDEYQKIKKNIQKISIKNSSELIYQNIKELIQND